MLGVDLHGLLGDHVRSHGVVPKGLRFHDALHVGRPTILRGGENARGVGHAPTDDDLLNLVSEHLLHQLGQRLELRLELLKLFLLILILDVEAFLGGGLQFFPIKFFQLLNCVLIDGVNHVHYLQALLPKVLQEGRGRNGSDAFACDVVDVVLALLHAVHVLLEAYLLIARLGGVETQELSDFGAVGGVLVDAELQALAELLVELLVVVLLLGDLSEHLQALLHEVLLDHAENLVLLEGLTRDVQGQVLRVDDALDHVQPLGHELLAVVHDEDTAHVQLDVVALLLALEQVEGRAPRHEQESAELELALNAEVLHGKVVLPLVAHLLDLLGLLLLFLLLLLLIDLLDLGLVTLGTILLLGLLLVLTVSDLLLAGLLDVELDGETDELTVLLDQILEAPLLEELGLVFLQVADDLGAALDLAVHHLGVLLHGERAASARLPNVLLIIVVLADHTDLVCDKVRRVEADAELADHAHVTTSGHGLHEGLRAGLSDGAKIVDELVLRHTDTGVLDANGRVGLVRDDLDEEV